MTKSHLMDLAQGFPQFALYLAVGLVLVALFLAIYVHVTPYPEIKLIREGNVAAAISLSGALIGFMLPLAGAVSAAPSVIDLALWGLVALVVQLLLHFLVRVLLPALEKDISEDGVAQGIFVGAIALAGGILNAACMVSP